MNAKDLKEEVSKAKPTTNEEEKIRKLEEELNNIKAQEKDNMLRIKAELENVRKRTKKDIEKAHKLALEAFTADLLPALDNLERALATIDRSNQELKATMEGIELTLKALLDITQRFGINVIDEANVAFNPNIHQAMCVLDSAESMSNKVITVLQKGYTLNGKLIRPAMVTVSKGK
ncbi:nucleotide exchange factor GrpE [Candidatus Tremblaya phenacola]|uniref:nucleotide exchange factor GrpE n=1 Tax=Candidatus Tremblayella phenacoccinincola TaxID=1010676 RepID=UPI001330180C|nr:nucleotide exchange factor GrpE [Candidatus Tremblaya phenacola]KAH0998340.1 Heat shock protein GrpE [Candidatus Tremblaya phenacola]